MKCPSCRKNNTIIGAAYCEFCGHKLSTGTVPGKIPNRISSKKIAVAAAIMLTVLLILAQGVNVICANISLNRLEQYIESGYVRGVSTVSIDADRLMYEEYMALMSGDLYSEEYQQKNDILSAIYQRTDIECGFVFPLFFSTNVPVEITSVDMDLLFDEIIDDIEENTSYEEISELIYNKISSSEDTLNVTLTLPMELTSNGWAIDTEDSEFKNAISGGLYSSYSNLYMSVLEEYYNAIESQLE